MKKKNNNRQYKFKTMNGYQYISKDAEWLESDAYRDLKPLARCLLEEFLIIYRPDRNGFLSISIKTAAKRLNVCENTSLNAFDDLYEHGFITLTKGHYWQERLAREWRLTIKPCNDREPTNDWRDWKLDHPVRITQRTLKKHRTQKLKQSASKNEATQSQILQQDNRNPYTLKIITTDKQ